MRHKYYTKLNELREAICEELNRLHYRSTTTSQFSDNRCIPIAPEVDDEYKEFVYMNGWWQVYDYRGLLTNVYAISVTRLCTIVDYIIDKELEEKWKK